MGSNFEAKHLASSLLSLAENDVRLEIPQEQAALVSVGSLMMMSLCSCRNKKQPKAIYYDDDDDVLMMSFICSRRNKK
jgi:hypothetical protein